jgi:hypothetical protein
MKHEISLHVHLNLLTIVEANCKVKLSKNARARGNSVYKIIRVKINMVYNKPPGAGEIVSYEKLAYLLFNAPGYIYYKLGIETFLLHKYNGNPSMTFFQAARVFLSIAPPQAEAGAKGQRNRVKTATKQSKNIKKGKSNGYNLNTSLVHLLNYSCGFYG